MATEMELNNLESWPLSMLNIKNPLLLKCATFHST